MSRGENVNKEAELVKAIVDVDHDFKIARILNEGANVNSIFAKGRTILHCTMMATRECNGNTYGEAYPIPHMELKEREMQYTFITTLMIDKAINEGKDLNLKKISDGGNSTIVPLLSYREFDLSLVKKVIGTMSKSQLNDDIYSISLYYGEPAEEKKFKKLCEDLFTKYRDKKYNGWMKGGDREILTKRFSDILDIVESREKEIDEAAAAMEEDPAMPNTTVKVSEHNVAGHSTHHVRGVW